MGYLEVYWPVMVGDLAFQVNQNLMLLRLRFGDTSEYHGPTNHQFVYVLTMQPHVKVWGTYKKDGFG